MRRFVALACCALYLAFGSVAGLAHVHESADHHHESRGLHFDHGHLGEAAIPAHGHHHPHANDHHGGAHHHGPPAEHDSSGPDTRHVDHHAGDALTLTSTAARSLDTGFAFEPLTVPVTLVTEQTPTVDSRDEEPDRLPRDPPGKIRSGPRAPPA